MPVKIPLNAPLDIVAFLKGRLYKLPPKDRSAKPPPHPPHTSLSAIHTKQASIEHSVRRGDQTLGH